MKLNKESLSQLLDNWFRQINSYEILSRLYDPDAGKISIDGYDISKVELYSLRRQIGIVPQDSLLFDGSVEDISLSMKDAS